MRLSKSCLNASRRVSDVENRKVMGQLRNPRETATHVRHPGVDNFKKKGRFSVYKPWDSSFIDFGSHRHGFREAGGSAKNENEKLSFS